MVGGALRLFGTSSGITCGEHLSRSWRWEKLVEVFTEFSKRIRGKARTQPFWFCWTWYWMLWLMVWFICLLEPSISWWWAEDSFSLTPVSLCRAVQNFDTKSLSRLEMISFGSPFSQYQLLKKISTSSSVLMFIQVGIMWMSKLRQSVDTIQLQPSSKGSGPIKSNVMLSPWSSGIIMGAEGQSVFG